MNDIIHRDADSLFRHLAEASRDPCYIADPAADFRLVYVNPAAAELLGRTRQHLLETTLADCSPDLSHARLRQLWQSLRADGGSTLTARAPVHDGQQAALQITMLHLAIGNQAFIAGHLRDISQAERTEKALRISESHLRTLLETLPDPVWLKDPDGIYLHCNKRFEQFFGASKAAILGKTDYDFVNRQLADFFREHDRIAMAAGRPSSNEEELIYASDGHRELVETVKTPMFDAEGKIIGVLGIARDITQRKALEDELRESVAIYKAAINTPALGFWMVDTEGRFLEVSDAYLRLSGYRRDELLGMTINDIDARESPAETAARISQVRQSGCARFRSLHRHKRGDLWSVEVFTSYSPIKGGLFFVFLEDITEKLEQERQLELAHQVFHTMDQAVVVTDADNQIVSVNPATEQITGYSFADLLGQNPRVFSSGHQDRAFYAAMWQSLNEHGHWEGEIWDRRKDGGVFPKWLTINAQRDADGRVFQYVSVFSDITERKKTEELIWKQANFDALTGLANRILFQTRLEQELQQCARSGSELAVLYMDLDGFKDINDSLGHATGDQLLVEIAQRLQQRARKSDTVARLGGDEFTLLVTHFSKPEQIGSLAEQLLDAVKEPIHLGANRIHIGASIGIALYPDDGACLSDLTRHADTAMYQAKASGKNTFRFFHPQMDIKANRRLALIHDLHRAVHESVFQLYYQPKIRLVDRRIIGMEMLLRWPREGGKMVSPAEFIPCAEETGLILSLGKWALCAACRQTAEWNQRFRSRLQVAVNLSARQFHQQSLVEEIAHSLQEHKLPGELLEVEITESILMSDVEQAILLMQNMRALGISIAIDDFGTGYSSLNYLKRFPISTLKIDRSFISDLGQDSQDTAIVRSVISLAESLDLTVVAEGVENAGQLELLQRHRCQAAQGYYLARPMPADAFGDFLIAHRDDLP